MDCFGPKFTLGDFNNQSKLCQGCGKNLKHMVTILGTNHAQQQHQLTLMRTHENWSIWILTWRHTRRDFIFSNSFSAPMSKLLLLFSSMKRDGEVGLLYFSYIFPSLRLPPVFDEPESAHQVSSQNFSRRPRIYFTDVVQ